MGLMDDFIALSLQAKLPHYLCGMPGIGKTKKEHAVTRALAFLTGKPWRTRTINVQAYMPEDIGGGYPAPDLQRRIAFMLANETLWADLDEHTNVFLDEITCSEGRQQSVLLRPLTEYAIGSFELPQVSWSMAGNPASHASGGHDLTPPLANRVCHVNFHVPHEEWVRGELQGWPLPTVPLLPENWRDFIPVAAALTVGYVQHQPTDLDLCPDNPAAAGSAWPSRRTWTMTKEWLAACEAIRASDELRTLAVAGCLGTGVATKMLGWLSSMDLPDPEALLAKPASFKLPAHSDAQFAVFSAVAAAVLHKLTPERWLAGWKIAALGAKQGAADVAACAVRAFGGVKERHPELPYPKAELEAFAPLLAALGLQKA